MQKLYVFQTDILLCKILFVFEKEVASWGLQLKSKKTKHLTSMNIYTYVAICVCIYVAITYQLSLATRCVSSNMHMWPMQMHAQIMMQDDLISTLASMHCICS